MDSRNKPKVKEPDTFSGSPSKLTAFLAECQLTFDLNPSRYRSERAKVSWVISYLREAPLHSVQPYLDNKPRPEFLQTWSNFQAYLRNGFGDPDELGTARQKLRSLTQDGSASTYFSKFRQYLGILGWSANNAAVVDRAIDGLRSHLKDELARHGQEFNSVGELSAYIIPLDNRLHV